MKKKSFNSLSIPVIIKNLPKKVQTSLFLLLLILFNSFPGLYAQSPQITLDLKNASFPTFILELQRQTNKNFIFNEDQCKQLKHLNLRVKGKTLEEVLKKVLKNTPLAYTDLSKDLITIYHDSECKIQVFRPDTIKGKILTSTGIPLAGANIQLVNSNQGCYSDINGRFALKTPASKGKLILSHIGYKTQTLSFNSTSSLSITMEEAPAWLDETHVIAYGSQTKFQETGAIHTIDIRSLSNIPANNIASLMQGLAPIRITHESGALGASPKINIRGYNSLSLENGGHGSDPLWVIDGVPVYSFSSPLTSLNSLYEINRMNIERIDILKDAASASIYGARSANGVILVTTKQGNRAHKKQLEAYLSYTSNISCNIPTRTIGRAERDLRFEAIYNFSQPYYNTTTGVYRYPETIEEAYANKCIMNLWNFRNIPILEDSLNPFYNNANNWYKYYIKPSSIIQAHLSYSMNKQKINAYIATGYYTENGIIRNTRLNRFDVMSNLDIILTPKCENKIRLYLAVTTKNRYSSPQANYNYRNYGEIETIPEELTKLSSMLPASVLNILQVSEKLKEKSTSYRLLSSWDFSYKFSEKFQLRSLLSSDLSLQTIHNQRISDPKINIKKNFISQQEARNETLFNENWLTYKKTFYTHHHLELLTGLSFQIELFSQSQGYKQENLHSTRFKSDLSTLLFEKDFKVEHIPNTMLGMFFRASYNFSKKYLAAFTLRRDGSSKFSKNGRWGTFPSLAIGYNFSEEKFMEQTKPFLDYGKLRFSYGIAGHQYEHPYLSQGSVMASDQISNKKLVLSDNEDNTYKQELTWETTYQWNAGLDLELFHRKLRLNIDYYHRKTKDLFSQIPVSKEDLSYKTYWTNQGAILNKGIEMQFKAQLLHTSDITWDISVNLARNWNKLLKSNNQKDYISPFYPNNISIIGKPLNGIYVYDDNGIYNSQEEVPYTLVNGNKAYLGIANGHYYRAGDRRIIDTDKNGIINGQDRIYGGSPLPVAYGGIATTFSWKNCTLSLQFTYSLGQHLLNAAFYESLGTPFSPNDEDMMKPIVAELRKIKFWQKPGDQTNFPANRAEAGLGNFTPYLKHHIEKVNYLKMKSASLNYVFPHLIKSSSVSIGLFLAGENLFTLTNYSGPDPETVNIVSGIDHNNIYPLARKITAGMVLKF